MVEKRSLTCAHDSEAHAGFTRLSDATVVFDALSASIARTTGECTSPPKRLRTRGASSHSRRRRRSPGLSATGSGIHAGSEERASIASCISAARGMSPACDPRIVPGMTESEDNFTKKSGQGVAIGIAIGIPMGAAMGMLLFDNIALGVGIGLSIGLALGVGFERSGKDSE